MARIVDVDELGEGTLDPDVLAYCTERGSVWVTTDLRAQAHITEWLNSGKTLPGVIMAVQRHRITPGRLVRFLERLASPRRPARSLLGRALVHVLIAALVLGLVPINAAASISTVPPPEPRPLEQIGPSSEPACLAVIVVAAPAVASRAGLA